MPFNPSIDVNSWKLIQWSADVPKLDVQLTELMLKLSTWCTNTGQVLTTGSIPWSGITGKRMADFYGTDSTNNNAYAITVNSDFTLTAGVTVYFSVTATNTGAPTLNVNATGAKPIVNKAGLALSASELLASKVHGVFYDGASWRIFTYLTRYFTGANPGNVTLDCLGFDAVNVYVNFTAVTSTTLTLAHADIGLDVQVVFLNSYTAPISYSFQSTNPAGTALGVWFVPQTAVTGIAAISLTGSQSVTNGLTARYQGKQVGNAVWLR